MRMIISTRNINFNHTIFQVVHHLHLPNLIGFVIKKIQTYIIVLYMHYIKIIYYATTCVYYVYQGPGPYTLGLDPRLNLIWD